jgi:hypothetical protein
VKVLSASAGGGSDRKPGFRGGGCHGRRRRARHRGFRLNREHISFIGAAASHCAHGLPRRARGPRPRPPRSAGGEHGRTGGYSGARPSTNAGLHVAVRTSRPASVHAMPWEGAAPRSARGPDGEAGAARVRCGVGQPATVSLYHALNA